MAKRKTKPKLRVAHMEIHEWGFAFGGEHFSAQIKWREGDERKDHQLEYAIARHQAIAFNKKDRDLVIKFKAGDMSSRFFSKEDVYAAAVAWVQDKPIDLLVDGYGLQPSPVVFCRDEALGEKLKPIGARFEAMYDETNDPWATFPKEAQKLEDQWKELVGQ